MNLDGQMKRFLVASAEESITSYPPKIVVARTKREALSTFLKQVTAKEDWFRKSVLDMCVNMSFAERFYLSSEQEVDRFIRRGEIGTEEEIVVSRFKSYFTDRPDLGNAYLQYRETEDESLITEEIYEFLASKKTPREHALVAIDLAEVEVLEMPRRTGP